MELPQSPHDILLMERAASETLHRLQREANDLFSDVAHLQHRLRQAKTQLYWVSASQVYIRVSKMVRTLLMLPGTLRILTVVGLSFALIVLTSLTGLHWLCVLEAAIATGVVILVALPSDKRLQSLMADLPVREKTLTRDVQIVTSQITDRRSRLHELQKQLTTAMNVLESIVNSRERRLAQLLSENWKAMRGPELEQFLAKVFQTQGYQVTHLGGTGDQGADLICERDGVRFVVQVKGYLNSVGNDAVQQAFAAQAFHHCHGCVVVTNSVFTSGAKELAKKVNCILIDEASFPDLVLGRLKLFSTSHEQSGAF